MKYLLPYRFKKIGLKLVPLGFLVWIMMQKGFFTYILTNLMNKKHSFQIINTTIAITSFFAFLIGFLFIGFSKEKIEDEFAKRIRLESYQFSTLLQICFIIFGFIIMVFTKELDKEGLVYFFSFSILLFWLTFIFRFNYIYHYKSKY